MSGRDANTAGCFTGLMSSHPGGTEHTRHMLKTAEVYLTEVVQAKSAEAAQLGSAVKEMASQADIDGIPKDQHPMPGILDLGAGNGEAVRIMREMGYEAWGLDLEAAAGSDPGDDRISGVNAGQDTGSAPHGGFVRRGDMLHTDFPDASFDAVFSQCSFYASGDVRGALAESRRILKPHGLLLLSDVFFEEPRNLLAEAGFSTLQEEDMTPAWREFFLRAIWEGSADGTCIPKGKCRYFFVIGRRD